MIKLNVYFNLFFYNNIFLHIHFLVEWKFYFSDLIYYWFWHEFIENHINTVTWINNHVVFRITKQIIFLVWINFDSLSKSLRSCKNRNEKKKAFNILCASVHLYRMPEILHAAIQPRHSQTHPQWRKTFFVHRVWKGICKWRQYEGITCFCG